MKVLWVLMLVAFVLGMLSKIIVGSIYGSMTREDSNNSLVKQIRLKYDNCRKLNISINNVDVFVEKSLENYRFCGFSLNGLNNISKEMGYICISLGVLNAIAFRNDFSAVIFGLGIAALSAIAIRLLEQIVDADNQKRIVIVELVDYLDNTNTTVHRDAMKDNARKDNAVKDNAVKHFSREASTEFNKLNKSFDKIQSTPKLPLPLPLPVDNRILEDILDEYLTWNIYLRWYNNPNNRIKKGEYYDAKS